jgi:ubiquinone/menaquinone biosynthesis C-methylase UbiE
MCYDRGTPTAISGNEYGIKRRFEALEDITTFKSKTVLDVGCGFGAYSLVAESYGASMSVGIDVNMEYIEKARSSLIVLADAHALPFRDSCFDIVLMVEVLEHLPCEMEVLKEVKRVLKSEGYLLLTVPNKFYPFETHGMKINNIQIPNMLGIGIPFLSWMPSYIRKEVEMAKIYTHRKLLNILREAGFLDVKVEWMMPPLDKLKRRNLAAALRKLLQKLEATWLKYFACHIIVVSTVIKYPDFTKPVQPLHHDATNSP